MKGLFSKAISILLAFSVVTPSIAFSADEPHDFDQAQGSSKTTPHDFLGDSQVHQANAQSIKNLLSILNENTPANSNKMTTDEIVRFTVFLDYYLSSTGKGRVRHYHTPQRQIEYFRTEVKKIKISDAYRFLKNAVSEAASAPAPVGPPAQIKPKTSLSAENSNETNRSLPPEEDISKMTVEKRGSFLRSLLTQKSAKVYSLNSFSFAAAMTAIAFYKYFNDYPSNPRVFEENKEMLENPATYAQLAPFHWMQMKRGVGFGGSDEALRNARSSAGLNVFEASKFPEIARRSGKLLYGSLRLSGLLTIPLAISKVIGKVSNDALYACYQVAWKKSSLEKVDYDRFSQICSNKFIQWTTTDLGQEVAVELANSFVASMGYFTAAQLYSDAKNVAVTRREKNLADRIRLLKVGTDKGALPATVEDLKAIESGIKDTKQLFSFSKVAMIWSKGVPTLKAVGKFSRVTGPLMVFLTVYQVTDYYLGTRLNKAFINDRIEWQRDGAFGPGLLDTLSACLPYYTQLTKQEVPASCQGIEVFDKLGDYDILQNKWHEVLMSDTISSYRNWSLYYSQLLNRYVSAKNFYRDVVWQIQLAYRNKIQIPPINAGNFDSQFLNYMDQQQAHADDYKYLPFFKMNPFFRLKPFRYIDFPAIERIQQASKSEADKDDPYQVRNAKFAKELEIATQDLTYKQGISLKMQPRMIHVISQVIDNELRINKNLSSEKIKNLYFLKEAFKSNKHSQIAQALFSLDYLASLDRIGNPSCESYENPMNEAFSNALQKVINVLSIQNPLSPLELDRYLDNRFGLSQMCTIDDVYDPEESLLTNNGSCVYEQIRQTINEENDLPDADINTYSIPMGPGGSYTYDYENYLTTGIGAVDPRTRDQRFYSRPTKTMVEYLLLSMVCGPDHEIIKQTESPESLIEALSPVSFLVDDRGWKATMKPPRITRAGGKPEICSSNISNGLATLIHKYGSAHLSNVSNIDFSNTNRNLYSSDLPLRAEIETLSLFYPFVSDGKYYMGIADYLFKNIDPSFLNVNFDKWWQQNYESRYFAMLENAYQDFNEYIIRQKYLPALHSTDKKGSMPLGIIPAIRQQANFYFDKILEPVYDQVYKYNPLLTKQHFIDSKDDVISLVNDVALVAERGDSVELKRSRAALEVSINRLIYLFGVGDDIPEELNDRNSAPFFVTYPDELAVGNVRKIAGITLRGPLAKYLVAGALNSLKATLLEAADAEKMANLFLRKKD